MAEAELAFRVLGPVEVARGGTQIPLGGRRQRALLALLLVEPGRAVSADWLIDQLWPDDPPSGVSTLPSYVSRLRSALGGHETIVKTESGYRLEVHPDQVDARRFERLADEGRAALAEGRARLGGERLRSAVALWRGPPFGELGDEGALRDEAERLERLRLDAVEARIDADLAVGRDAELLDEIETLVVRHPYRERFWAQLMLAMYRAGRQADALATYQRARRVLRDELGLEPGPALRDLEHAILRQDVAVAPPRARNNLPAPPSSFVGRDAELAAIGRLLDETRLLTLTGVGGVGKTRLALEAAGRLVPDVPDGVWFIDLSELADGTLILPAIARVLGLGERAGSTASDAVLDHLRQARLVLVIDNCEHVRSAAADVSDRLLNAAAGLRILATSREALGVSGEVDYPVPPMSLPSTAAGRAEIERSEAVQLFLGRARAARPALSDDDRALDTAARIARDLDGLPLAIELAAARAKALSLEDIADRLTDRFRFLVSWRRLSPARHRTLREAMDWSFELLGPDERQLLARLSVFAGWFTLEAVTRICADGGEEQALVRMERLVAASLVVVEEFDGTMHYRLLATVRDYAAEHLDEQTAEQVRPAHARYYLRLAERADLTAVRRGTGQRIDLAIAAQDNLRRALAWAVETGAAAFGLELATSLERFWAIHDPGEGLRWFAALFERPEAADVPPAVRANALRAYGGAADMSGDDQTAQALWERSLAIFRELGDEAGQAVLLHRLAISAQRQGNLGPARDLVGASHALHERLGNRWGMAQTLGTLGAIARDEGDTVRAGALLEDSLELAREARVPWWVGGVLAELANVSLAAGQIDDADRRARESLSLADGMQDRAGRVLGVGLLARIAAERQQHGLARTLWAAVKSEDAGAPLGGWRRHRDAYRDRITTLLPDDGRDPGDPPSLEDAVALALGGPDGGTSEIATAG